MKEHHQNLRQGTYRLLPGLLAAMIPFFLYLKTLAPGPLQRNLADGLADSGLFQIRIPYLSIPLPTGYPTYMLLGKLFTYLPFGNEAYRINLASAVYAAAAIFVLFLVAHLLTGRVLASAAAALLFGVSPAFWSQAVIAEVYTLNALLIALVLLALLHWHRKRRDRSLLAAALLSGLTLTNHLTSGMLLPAGLALVYSADRTRLRSLKLWLGGAGLFFLGLLPYLYIPLRTASHPPLSTYPLSTPQQILSFMTGGPFRAQMFVFGPGQLPGRLEYYLSHLLHQFPPGLLPVALIGLLSLARRDRPVLAMFAVLFCGWLLFDLEYDIPDIWVYFIETYLVAALLIAEGLAKITDLLHGLRRFRLTAGRFVWAPAALVLLLTVAPAATAAAHTYHAVNLSKDHIVQKKIEVLSTELPLHSTLITDGVSAWYMQLIEHRRKDVRVISPFLEEDRLGTYEAHLWRDLARRYLKEGKGPVYIEFPDGAEDEYVSSFESYGMKLLPCAGGEFYQAVRLDDHSRACRVRSEG